jgi:hypothetical protein
MKELLPYLLALLPFAILAFLHVVHTGLVLLKLPAAAAWVQLNTPVIERFLLGVARVAEAPKAERAKTAFDELGTLAKDNADATVHLARAQSAMGLGVSAIVMVLALLVTGCGASPLKTAIVVSNGLSDVGQAASTTLDSTCVAAYKSAKTEADIAAIDKPCLPAAKAYAVLRATHAALVAAIVAVEAGADPAQLDAAIQRARDAASTLGAVISEVAK